MKTRVRFDHWNVILFLVTAFLFCLNPAYAQGNGKAIRDKLSDVLNKTDTLGSNLEALCDLNCQGTPAGQRFKQKTQRLRQAHTRVKNAHGRTSDADYQEVVRRRPKKKADGCDAQVQVCLPEQPSPGFALADPEYDDARATDTVADLDEVGSDIDALNSLLAGNVPPPVPTPDVNLENAEYFFPASMRPSSEVAFAAFLANLAAEKASAVADHFCDQVVVGLGFGGNGSSACSVVEGIHQVLDAVYQVMDYISQDATSAEVTGTYNRTKNIFDQLVITDSKTDGTNEIVQAMGKKLLQLEENQRTIMQNQRTIMQLLSTPLGQRPGFPKPSSTSSTTSKAKGP